MYILQLQKKKKAPMFFHKGTSFATVCREVHAYQCSPKQWRWSKASDRRLVESLEIQASWIKNKIQLYFVYKKNTLDSKIQIDGK